MKYTSIIKLIILSFCCISSYVSGQETSVNADTLKLYQSRENFPAVIKLTVLSDNTFNFYMKIVEDNSVINCDGTWNAQENHIEHTFHNPTFITTALFDTTTYANDYTILNDSTITFDDKLWSINIWGMWCNDIKKTK